MLGLRIPKRRIAKHVKERVRAANTQLTKYKRFSSCSEKVKIQHYKSLIKPIMEYLRFPLNIISKNSRKSYRQCKTKSGMAIWFKIPKHTLSRYTTHLLHHTNQNENSYTGKKSEGNAGTPEKNSKYTKVINNNLDTGNQTWFPQFPLVLQEPLPIHSYRERNYTREAREDHYEDPDDHV